MKSDGINQPGRFSGGRLLAAGASLLMLSPALLPLLGAWPETWFWVVAAIALVAAILGGFVLPQGSTLAFLFLWAAFGMAAAVGTIGIFSVGLIFLIAAIFLLFAIFATPNTSEIALRYDMRYIAAFAIGYLGIFFFFFLFAGRF